MNDNITKRQDAYWKKSAVLGLSEEQKNIEKIKREKNRLEFENKHLVKEIQRREKILETIEAYLVQRIEKLEEANINKTAVYELNNLLNGLREERSVINYCQPKKRKDC